MQSEKQQLLQAYQEDKKQPEANLRLPAVGMSSLRNNFSATPFAMTSVMSVVTMMSVVPRFDVDVSWAVVIVIAMAVTGVMVVGSARRNVYGTACCSDNCQTQDYPLKFFH